MREDDREQGEIPGEGRRGRKTRNLPLISSQGASESAQVGRSERAVVYVTQQFLRKTGIAMKRPEPCAEDCPNRVGVPAGRYGGREGVERILSETDEAKHRERYAVQNVSAYPKLPRCSQDLYLFPGKSCGSLHRLA